MLLFMIKNVYNYFENLDKKSLPRNKHNLILKGDSFDNFSNDSKTILIDGIKYYIKNNNEEFSVLDIASSRMYNAIGMPTPPIFTIEKNAEISNKPQIKLATQDVKSIEDFSFSIAYDALPINDMIQSYHLASYKWEPIYDTDLRMLFYKYMTPECFNQLTGLFLIDELRSEIDRKKDNYFLYKSAESKKYEGVLAIDNELMQVLRFDLHKKSDFENFLATPYQSFNMIGIYNNGSYIKRIKDIKELIEDGMLTQNQIELIKKAISYNLPNEVKIVAKNPYFKNLKKSSYDATARLWEYNQKNLGKDLGL